MKVVVICLLLAFSMQNVDCQFAFSIGNIFQPILDFITNAATFFTNLPSLLANPGNLFTMFSQFINNSIKQMIGNNPLLGLIQSVPGIIGNTLNGAVSLVNITLDALANLVNIPANLLTAALNTLHLDPTGALALLKAVSVAPTDFSNIVQGYGNDVLQVLSNYLQEVLKNVVGDQLYIQIAAQAGLSVPDVVNLLLNAGITPADFSKLVNQAGRTAANLAPAFTAGANGVKNLVQQLYQAAQNAGIGGNGGFPGGNGVFPGGNGVFPGGNGVFPGGNGGGGDLVKGIQDFINNINKIFGNVVNTVGNVASGVLGGALDGLSKLLNINSDQLGDLLKQIGKSPTYVSTLISSLGNSVANTLTSSNLATAIPNLIQQLLQSLPGIPIFNQAAASGIDINLLANALLNVGISPNQLGQILPRIQLSTQQLKALLDQNGGNYQTLANFIADRLRQVNNGGLPGVNTGGNVVNNALSNILNGLNSVVNLPELVTRLGISSPLALTNALTTAQISPTGLSRLIGSLGAAGNSFASGLANAGMNILSQIQGALEQAASILTSNPIINEFAKSANINPTNLVKSIIKAGLTVPQFIILVEELKLRTAADLLTALSQAGGNPDAFVANLLAKARLAVNGSVNGSANVGVNVNTNGR